MQESEEDDIHYIPIGKRKRIVSDSEEEPISKTPKYRNQDGVVSFDCPQCNYSGKSAGIVYSHMADKHGMDSFVCEFCKFVTKNKTSMYNHRTRYCKSRKIEGMECAETEGKVTSKDVTGKKEYKNPIYVSEDGITKFKCSHCNFEGKSTGKVYSHMVEEHKMEKFVCEFCHFETGNKTSMYNHKTRYCKKLKENN